MARVSLCLIARDEARLLPGCLESVRGAVDEIVLVDTGSADRTREIARAAGAVVLEQPWGDDFAAARNRALDAATGDWILQLDADERLAGDAARRILGAVRDGAAEAFLLPLHHAECVGAAPADVVSGASRHGEPDFIMRLFRKVPGARYRGRIHECIDEALAARGARFASLPADIVHLGGAPALRASLGKRSRNIRLLRLSCADEPDNVNAYGYLAAELEAAGETAEATAVAERGWALAHQQPRTRSLHQLAVARSVLALDRGAPQVVLECADLLQRRDGLLRSDMLLLSGVAHLRLAAGGTGPERREHAERASTSLRAAMTRQRGPESVNLIDGSSSWAAAKHLGMARLLVSDFTGALEAFSLVREARPGDRDALLGIAECRVGLGEAGVALKLLEPALDDTPDGWMLAATAARALGASVDARMLLGEAHRRLPRGFRSPHRREAAQALADALARHATA